MRWIEKLRRRKDDRGFALIIVLWAIVLVSGLALAAAAAVRTDSHITRNAIDEAAARHLAQSAIYQTVAELLDEETKSKIDLTGEKPHQVDLFGKPVSVRVVDECSKVDINTGWSGLIVGLIGGQRSGMLGFAVAQAILDWRDPDHRRRPRGAEDGDYSEAGRPHGAGDSFFEVIEELQLVKGMDLALYRRLAPYITVNCLNSGVDAAVASPTVLASVPDVDPVALSTFLDARRRGTPQQAEILVSSLEEDVKYFEISPQAAFEMTATVQSTAGVAAAWRAILWLTGDSRRPFVIRAWEKAIPRREEG